MKIYSVKLLTILLVPAILSSCNRFQETSGLEEKKKLLRTLKDEKRALEQEITSLEEEIKKEDSTFLGENLILVSTRPVTQQEFVHKIEVRGSVRSNKNVMISSETIGRINYGRVSQGDRVKKGDILFKLDAETLKNRINELQKSLELATAVYQRQSNLWENQIGSEIQYLEAKNKKEMLERQLATANSQLSQTIIRAPFGGTVDEVFVKTGEMAQPGIQLLRLISLEDMYIEAEVSERYVSSFNTGDKVRVLFPALETEMNSTINSVGQVINEKSRKFKIEVKIPEGTRINVKPNLTAVLQLTDYTNEKALVIPTNIIQRDNEGDYIFLVDTTHNPYKAQKVHITRGISYKNETEVLEGLSEGQTIIDEGFKDVSDGLQVKVVN